MNKQMLELYKQAHVPHTAIDPSNNMPYETTCFSADKFAELIVQECMNQVKEQYLPVLEDKEMMKDTHWDGYVQCGVDSVVAIREHFFGVEE